MNTQPIIMWQKLPTVRLYEIVNNVGTLLQPDVGRHSTIYFVFYVCIKTQLIKLVNKFQ